MAARLPVKPIKHSLTTALRQAVSKLETQRHRLAKKTRPPARRLPCDIVGVEHFFNYAYLPALNRKDSPLVVSGILTRGQNQFQHAQQGLRYSTTHFAGYDSLLASGIKSVLILLPNHLLGSPQLPLAGLRQTLRQHLPEPA
jgi:hypothetical protein